MDLTEKTRQLLHDQTLSNIGNFTSLVDAIRNGIESIERAKEFMQTNNLEISVDQMHLKRFSEYVMLLGLIWLDITTAFRVYLNAKEKYETIYATKQLVITINEGFKKIYNYVGIDKNGNLLTSARNKSFWVKDIGALVSAELPSLSTDYNEITILLNEYDDTELKAMREPRNLFVHYDDNPSKVYDMLIHLDIEATVKKTIPFLTILSQMVKFGRTLQVKYAELIEDRKYDVFDSLHEKFESLRANLADNKDGLDFLDQIQADLKKFKSQ